MFVYLSVSEQNSRTRFSLNGCLQHWLISNWNWWPWVKGERHSDVILIFFFIIIYLFPNFVSKLSYVWSIWNSVCRLEMLLVDYCLNFIKIESVMTSLWRHLSFIQTIAHILNSIKRTEVKQHRPWSVLGWVTAVVCQFLLIVLWMRL